METLAMVLVGIGVVLVVSFSFVLFKIVLPVLMIGVVLGVCYGTYRAFKYVVNAILPSQANTGGI